MRVISGSAGGLKLRTPDTQMRPTMDRVKAAIFSSLGERVPGARVLDLFAGSGAYGIEALSRGSRHALFVEHQRKAVETIQGNLRFTKLTNAAQVLCLDVFAWLKQAAANPAGLQKFDLIFADPPYDLGQDESGTTDRGEVLLQAIADAQVLAPEGVLILEQAAAHPAREISAFALTREKRYGKARICYYQWP